MIYAVYFVNDYEPLLVDVQNKTEARQKAKCYIRSWHLNDKIDRIEKADFNVLLESCRYKLRYLQRNKNDNFINPNNYHWLEKMINEAKRLSINHEEEQKAIVELESKYYECKKSA